MKNETSSTYRIKSYARLEAEVSSLEDQVAFYRTELENVMAILQRLQEKPNGEQQNQ